LDWITSPQKEKSGDATERGEGKAGLVTTKMDTARKCYEKHPVCGQKKRKKGGGSSKNTMVCRQPTDKGYEPEKSRGRRRGGGKEGQRGEKRNWNSQNGK